MKIGFLVIAMISAVSAFAQETLDVDKYSKCELFPEKESYDRQKRIEEIEKLNNQKVTVYIVKGKENNIKTIYTGTVSTRSITSDELSDKAKASVLTVETDAGNEMKTAYFPLTDKSYRIYLTDCLEQNK